MPEGAVASHEDIKKAKEIFDNLGSYRNSVKMSRACTEALRWQGVWRGEYGNYIEEIVFDYFRGKGNCIGHYRRGGIKEEISITSFDCEFDENAVRKKDGSAVFEFCWSSVRLNDNGKFKIYGLYSIQRWQIKS